MYSPVFHVAGSNTNMKKKFSKAARKRMAKAKAKPRSLPSPRAAPSQRLLTMRDAAAPSAVGTIVGRGSKFPKMVMSGNCATVQNFELVKSFPSATGNFDISTIYANPGIAVSFPWLSGLAQNYSKFRWRFLRFFYSSSCPTSTTGKVFIYVDYNWASSNPTTLAQVVSGDTSSTGPAWFGGTVNVDKGFGPMASDADIFTDVDCTRLTQPWYFVRTSNTYGGGGSLTGAPTGGIGTLAFSPGTPTDESAYTVRVCCGNNGVTSSTVPGELYVSYICDLIEPVASVLTS